MEASIRDLVCRDCHNSWDVDLGCIGDCRSHILWDSYASVFESGYIGGTQPTIYRYIYIHAYTNKHRSRQNMPFTTDTALRDFIEPLVNDCDPRALTL